MTDLRPEASPLAYQRLYDSQREAFNQCLDMLSRGLKAARTTEIDTSTPWLDRNRDSRLIFLSGARGSGKTTVLLSLVEATTRPASALGEITSTAIGHLHKRILWLEPLNVETSPGVPRLVTAILARIESLLGSSLRDTSGLLASHSTVTEKALDSLRRFNTQAAVAWFGASDKRLDRLEPDVLAVELKRVEHERLSLRTRFAQTLDDVAKALSQGGANNLAFVLPIDDFDLHPQLCVELLNTLRMLSVPRLLPLVVGDLRLAEAVLNLQHSSEIAKAVKGALDAGISSFSSDEVKALTGETAANASRKLIPPSACVTLDRISWKEQALEYRPRGHADALDLATMLHQSKIIFDPQRQILSAPVKIVGNLNLFEFLFANEDLLTTGNWCGAPLREDEARRAQLQDIAIRAIYTGSACLYTWPRRVADLWLEARITGACGGRPKQEDRARRSRRAPRFGDQTTGASGAARGRTVFGGRRGLSTRSRSDLVWRLVAP